MPRQKSRDHADSWRLVERDGGMWLAREIPPGWQLEHHILIEDGVRPVIAETRVRWPESKEPPSGGISSALLRQVTVRGTREAATKVLEARGMGRPDMRELERASADTRRRGEAKRWSLAITSLAYVKALEAGSKRPNEDAARALGIPVRTVRDRLYAARRSRPPFVTGGGGRGRIGRVTLTDAAYAAMDYRIRLALAALGMPPSATPAPFWQQTVASFATVVSALLFAAERRVPGLWEMGLDEVAARGAELRGGALELPPGKRLTLTRTGLQLLDEEVRE